MSYNIKHGVGNDDSLALARSLAVIQVQDPDLLALQEIDHLAKRSNSVDQTAYFSEALRMEGQFGQFMDFQGGAYGMATFSALPVKSTQVLNLPDGKFEPRSSTILEVELNSEASILFANVHFDWISGEDGQATRTAQAQALIDHLNGFELPVVITGDFNCKPDSPTMQLFYDAGFVFADKGEDRMSFQLEDHAEIDHVIYRNTEDAQVTVRQIDLLDEPLVSDHRPLIAVLEITLR